MSSDVPTSLSSWTPLTYLTLKSDTAWISVDMLVRWASFCVCLRLKLLMKHQEVTAGQTTNTLLPSDTASSRSIHEGLKNVSAALCTQIHLLELLPAWCLSHIQQMHITWHIKCFWHRKQFFVAVMVTESCQPGALRITEAWCCSSGFLDFLM